MKDNAQKKLYECLIHIKIPEEESSRPLRQREKMRELSNISKICFDRKHGTTTESFYKCVQNEAGKLLCP